MEKIRRIAFIGNYLPRLCGIATFTTDLVQSVQKSNPNIECFTVAMNDRNEGYKYPSEVKFEINQNIFSDYNLAAEYLNFQQVDLVCLQHEYGIFGGNEGEYILHLLRNLRMPIVSTLHTVLSKPNEKQKKILQELSHLSSRVIVMAEKAVEFLEEIYEINKSKIILVPHGIPDMPFVDPNFYKDQFGVEGKKVILTFGLLSRNKGIEYVIEALPKVIEKNPDVVYLVLGVTHPNVKKYEGEEYRQNLERLVKKLGIDNNVFFVNRFVDIKELCEFIGATDIYITPYLNEDQIISGTLSYALGLGKATISTPYWCAKELLRDGRGILVNFRDKNAISDAINKLLADDLERNSMRKKAYLFSRGAIWPQVASSYLAVFNEVKEERIKNPIPAFKITQIEEFTLPEININHLITLTDDTGILQHATYSIPNRKYGYCLDDNSRALLFVVLTLNMNLYSDILSNYQIKYLSFIQDSLNPENGWFRNFMSYNRSWLEEKGSKDSHSRTIWSLGITSAISSNQEIIALSTELFHRGLQNVNSLEHPRALAYSLIGIHAYLSKFSGDTEVRRIKDILLSKLLNMFSNIEDKNWPWFNDLVSYANARIPHALFLSGHWIDNQNLIQKAFIILDWLIEIQFDNNIFSPIGNHGWYQKGKEKAKFDQQPIEVNSMIDACLLAYLISSDKKYLKFARNAFNWFIGQNDLGIPLYDYKTGGCCDGLSPNGANLNKGAESTLACLLSLITMYSFEANKTEILFTKK